MPSPFESIANAELIFHIPSTEMESDPYGNPVPKTEILKVIALLKFSGNVGNRNSEESINRSKESDSSGITGAGQISGNWSGYLVDPTLLPATVKPGMVADAEIVTGLQKSASGDVEPYVEKGEFLLLASPQNPYLIASAIEDVSPISGTFTRTVQ
ncbi:MAG: hypothetical protein M3N42_06440 [Cyanobacteriota bacterium]|nr:hypothetical protein [Cyanobacteriota bacterium]